MTSPSTLAALVVVRHGETEWSRLGRHTGATDIALTAAGEDQARALGARLAGTPWAAVFTSPLRRAIDTGRLAGFGGTLVADPDLREWDYGEYEGLTTAAIRGGRPGWSLWRDGAPGGETAPQVGERADRFLVRAAAVDGAVLVIAHGHLLRVLAARWVGLPPGDGARLGPPPPCAIGHLGFDHDTAAVTGWAG